MARVGLDLGEHLAGRGARRVEPGTGRRGRECGGVVALPASSTPIRSVVVATSKPAAPRASPTWRANAASWVARTSAAPSSSAALACAGPPIAPTAHEATRSDTYAAGSVPSGGTRPFDITSTPLRGAIPPA